MKHAEVIREIQKSINEQIGGGVAILTREDGQEVLYVEETQYNAIEIASAFEIRDGWFMEPVNSGLVAVWES